MARACLCLALWDVGVPQWEKPNPVAKSPLSRFYCSTLQPSGGPVRLPRGEHGLRRADGSPNPARRAAHACAPSASRGEGGGCGTTSGVALWSEPCGITARPVPKRRRSMALLSPVRNDSAFLEEAGERAGICRARRSAVLYLLSILSRIDNTSLARGSDVDAVTERTARCFCHRPLGCGEKTPIIVWLQKALELLLQIRRFQVKFFSLKFFQSKLSQQYESNFILMIWNCLQG